MPLGGASVMRARPFRRGGHVAAHDVAEDISRWTPAKPRKAEGGGIGVTAGSATGLGRLQLRDIQRREREG
jgi:hypothetical protein